MKEGRFCKSSFSSLSRGEKEVLCEESGGGCLLVSFEGDKSLREVLMGLGLEEGGVFSSPLVAVLLFFPDGVRECTESGEMERLFLGLVGKERMVMAASIF